MLNEAMLMESLLFIQPDVGILEPGIDCISDLVLMLSLAFTGLPLLLPVLTESTWLNPLKTNLE